MPPAHPMGPAPTQRRIQYAIVRLPSAGEEKVAYPFFVPSMNKAEVFAPPKPFVSDAPVLSVRSRPFPDLSAILPFDTASMSHQMMGSGRSAAAHRADAPRAITAARDFIPPKWGVLLVFMGAVPFRSSPESFCHRHHAVQQPFQRRNKYTKTSGHSGDLIFPLPGAEIRATMPVIGAK